MVAVREQYKLLRNKISDILSYVDSTNVTFALYITSGETNETRVFTLIEQLQITQQFHSNFGDRVSLNMKATMDDFLFLQRERQDLTANLFIFYLNITGTRYDERKPYTLNRYKVIINNPIQLQEKVFNPRELDQYNLVSVDMDLIDKAIYDIRHRQYMQTFLNADVKTVILDILDHYDFNLDRTHISNPDNKFRYENLVVPPAYNFNNVLDFVQTKFGVYNSDIAFYFNSQDIYVFPPNELPSKSRDVVNIYASSLPEQGSKHRLYRDDPYRVDIIINEEPEIENMAQKSSEEKGTSFNFYNSGASLDQYTETRETVGTRLTQNTGYMSSIGSNTLASTNENPRHIPSTENIFKYNSDLTRDQCVYLNGTWELSQYGLIKPYANVSYYFEEDGEVMKKCGQISGINFIYNKINTLGEGYYTYNCNSSLTMRLEL